MFLALQDPKPFIVTVDSGSRPSETTFADVIIERRWAWRAPLIVASLVLGAGLALVLVDLAPAASAGSRSAAADQPADPGFVPARVIPSSMSSAHGDAGRALRLVGLLRLGPGGAGDVEVRPRQVAGELAQERRGGHRAAGPSRRS